ncbi:MAG TPA: DUF3341 domain-containing protein [Polyangia bacterium]|nr:DUF3341 domain-containing protein [Polyangia bacterium]
MAPGGLLMSGRSRDPGNMRSGLAAEFVSANDLLIAVQLLWERGYRRLDAFTPHPVEGLEEALYLGRSRLNWIVFPLAIGGAAFAFWLQWYCNAWSYAIDVGGRTPFAWITDIPITFETGVLAASLVGFVAFFWTVGLPRLVHPLFEVEGFDRASIDRFWLAIDAEDEHLELPRTVGELLAMAAVRVARFGELAS